MLDAIGLVVKDIAASAAFYRRVGLEFPADASNEQGHVEAVLPSGLRVMLDSHELMQSFSEGWRPQAGSSPTLAFLCSGPDEVDRLYEELIQEGAEGVKEPWDAFWGQRYACLKDLDGHGLDLFAPLAQQG